MRFLVVRTDFIGDTVLSSTFIKMLKKTTNAEIDSVCYEYNYLAIQYNADISNKYYLYQKPNSIKKVKHNKDIIKQLQKFKYDAIFMLNRARKHYQIPRKISTKFIFGHRVGNKSITSAIFCRITELSNKYNYLHYDHSIHEIYNLVNLLKFGFKKMGLPYETLTLDQQCYFYTPNFDPTNLKYISNRNNKTIVFNISGQMQQDIRYITISLARSIIEDLRNLGKEVLLVSTTKDLARAKHIIAETGEFGVKLYNEDNLIKLAEHISKYKYFIGADGGLLHIAAGLQLSCIGLFHKQRVYGWHPWTPKQICIQTPSKRIYDISSSEVITALKQLEKLV